MSVTYTSGVFRILSLFHCWVFGFFDPVLPISLSFRFFKPWALSRFPFLLLEFGVLEFEFCPADFSFLDFWTSASRNTLGWCLLSQGNVACGLISDPIASSSIGSYSILSYICNAWCIPVRVVLNDHSVGVVLGFCWMTLFACSWDEFIVIEELWVVWLTCSWVPICCDICFGSISVFELDGLSLITVSDSCACSDSKGSRGNEVVSGSIIGILPLSMGFSSSSRRRSRSCLDIC